MTLISNPLLAAGIPRRTWLAASGLALVLFCGLFWAGERWAVIRATELTDDAALRQAQGQASLFASEMQKFRLLPVALAEYPNITRLLRSNTGAAAANVQLESLAARTNAAAIYVIGADGVTLAASNHRTTGSFVGQNYGFRPYFQNALRHGAAELFALGTVSGRPGLFLARRIGPAEAPLGVIVVKIEFRELASLWSRQPGSTFIVDEHDVLIISSRADWVFNTLRPLNTLERAAIKAARQFQGLPLAPLAIAVRNGNYFPPGSAAVPHRAAVLPVPLSGARLWALVPMNPALAGARAQARIVVAIAVFLLAGIAAWSIRQTEQRRTQRRVREELEARVLERTAALAESNQRLLRESAEKELTETRYRAAREELAQANRLATLGQIVAGVAHEINQPVAAIRAFAENANTLLQRGDTQRTKDNLQRVVELTTRIATITAELRQFARRRTVEVAPQEVAAAIAGALLLVGHRAKAQRVRVDWSPPAASHAVLADRVRLEQVLVNLLQNSLDALSSTPAAHIHIEIARTDSRVRVLVTDNGPGISAEFVPHLFTPFATGRADGLGLGLPIARDIARELGGELTFDTTFVTGARFVLELQSA